MVASGLGIAQGQNKKRGKIFNKGNIPKVDILHSNRGHAPLRRLRHLLNAALDSAEFYFKLLNR